MNCASTSSMRSQPNNENSKTTFQSTSTFEKNIKNFQNLTDILTTSSISKEQCKQSELLIPIQLHTSCSGNDNLPLDRSTSQNNFRQYFCSMDRFRLPTKTLKPIINLQIIRNNLVELSPHFDIRTHNKNVFKKNEENEIHIGDKNNISSEELKDKGWSENNQKSLVMVNLTDPILSSCGTSKAFPNVLENIKKHKLNYGPLAEILQKSAHYTPYPLLSTKNGNWKNRNYDAAKINIGNQFQAEILSVFNSYDEIDEIPAERCIWKANLLTENEIDQYCEILKTNLLFSNIISEEEALKILLDSHGNIHMALIKLLHNKRYQSLGVWTEKEFETFNHFLQSKGKKFDVMSKIIKTKTAYQCVELYYLCKKLCTSQFNYCLNK